MNNTLRARNHLLLLLLPLQISERDARFKWFSSRKTMHAQLMPKFYINHLELFPHSTNACTYIKHINLVRVTQLMVCYYKEIESEFLH